MEPPQRGAHRPAPWAHVRALPLPLVNIISNRYNIRIHPMTYVGLKVEGVVTVIKAHLALSIDLS